MDRPAPPPRPAATADIPGVEDLQAIGRGGFGVVYRGRQRELDREVAVKIVSSPGAPEAAVERWRREVTAMGRLSNHPNIVAVYAGGVTDDGSPYLIMPYVPGGSLGDHLRSQGPLGAAAVAPLGAKLAGALATAHEAGVLHRDVKPDNVLLSPYGEPQLTDFGIARLVDATTTAAGTIHASIPYAAPEVLSGQPATEAADLYGLGATLYACLVGAPPFSSRHDESLVALVGRIASQAPGDLRAHGVPDALAAIIERALAKAPAERIATADELRRRLEAASAPPAGDEAGTTQRLSGPTAKPPRADTSGPSGPTAKPPRADTSGPSGPTAKPPRADNDAMSERQSALAVEAPEPPRAAPATSVGGADAISRLARGERPEPTAAPSPDPPVPGPSVPGKLQPIAPPPSVGPPRRRPATAGRPGAIAVAVLVVALLLGIVGWAATRDDDAGDAPPATGAEPSDELFGDTSDETSTSTGNGAEGAEAAEIGEAATEYFEALGSGSVGLGYSLLSPEFQAAQSPASYVEFWSDKVVEVVGEPTVDRDDRTATVPITIDGRREDFQLSFVQRDDGTWLVDGPRPG